MFPDILSTFFEPDPVELRKQPKWLSKVRPVAKYADRVATIEALGPAMESLSDDELKGKTGELKAKLKDTTLDGILPEAFAVCREASRRTLGLYHYDVQLAGGIALHEGTLAEMATGEGKTLVATLPCYLRALAGQGAHVVTVNDYLARRDAETLAPLYEFLGMTVGVVQGTSDTKQRQQAYNSDVTYVTNNELGFDYLRDNLCFEEAELTVTQRGVLSFAIVDEADSILIDEARTPLIISSEGDASYVSKYSAATDVARYLTVGRDYEVDAKAKRTTLTERGYATACELFGVQDLFALDTKWAAYLLPALNAKELYLRERDYIVTRQDGEPSVAIVDEFTGRVMEGRRWNGGLHQAVEAKEGVAVRPEQETAASITYQSLFLLYDTLSGMTGTALTEKNELKNTYELDVVTVPTAKPMLRDDRPDLVYPSKLDKFRNVLREIAELHEMGRPVLVGTTTVEDSALISELLDNEDVPHKVLNAKPEVAQREGEIVAQAGRLGAVTIATNMAGRGTDILLGGNAGLIAKIYARTALAPKVDDRLGPLVKVQDPASFYPCDLDEATVAAMEEAAAEAAVYLRNQVDAEAQERAAYLAAVRRQRTLRTKDSPVEEEAVEDEKPPPLATDLVLERVDEFIASAFSQKENNLARAAAAVEKEFSAVINVEREKVRNLGGLVVLGTERHESRRIDLQLRGRSGRQGDLGESVFVISLEDKMFNVFGSDKMSQLRRAFEFAGDDGEPLSSDMLTKSLSTIQEKVEGFYRDARENLFKYDKIIDGQRRVFYSRRAKILRAPRDELVQMMTQYAQDTARDVVGNKTNTALKNKLPVDDVAVEATTQLQLMYPAAAKAIDNEIADLLANADGKVRLDNFEACLTAAAKTGIDEQLAKIDAKAPPEEDLGAAVLRFMILREFDRNWKSHLRDMELLREAVGFRGYAQVDPYAEWTIESNERFKKLSANIYRFSAITFLSLDPEVALVQKEPGDDMLLQPPAPVQDDQTSPARLPPRPQDVKSAGVNTASPSTGNRAARRAKKAGSKKTRRKR